MSKKDESKYRRVKFEYFLKDGILGFKMKYSFKFSYIYNLIIKKLSWIYEINYCKDMENKVIWLVCKAHHHVAYPFPHQLFSLLTYAVMSIVLLKIQLFLTNEMIYTQYYIYYLFWVQEIFMALNCIYMVKNQSCRYCLFWAQ